MFLWTFSLGGMHRIWQWAWDRYATRYSWAIYGICLPVLLPTYLLSTLGIVALEESGRFLFAAAITVAAVLVLVYVMVIPGAGRSRVVDQWAAGRPVDEVKAWRPRTRGRGESSRAR